MATKIKLGGSQWGVKENGLLARNDEDGIFKAIEMDFSRSSTATRETSAGTIGDSPLNTPRIDFTDDSNGALLLEPQSTNLITDSEDFMDASWSKSNVGTGVLPVVTANQGISPKGDLTADRVQFDLGGGTTASDLSTLSALVTLTGLNENNRSIYLKSNTETSYDLIFGTNDTTSALIKIRVTNEWQRFDITQISPSDTITNIYFGLRNGVGGVTGLSDTADILVWGAQLEEQSYPTSYIKTEGATATRIADTCSKSGLGSYINSSEGVLYVESSALADDETNRHITLSDGTDINRLVLKYDNQSNIIQAFNRVSGVETAFLTASVTDITLFSKCALKFKLNDYALWIDGVKVDTDTSSTTFPSSTLNDLKFSATNAEFYGKVKDLRVYDTALSDSELKALTS